VHELPSKYYDDSDRSVGMYGGHIGPVDNDWKCPCGAGVEDIEPLESDANINFRDNLLNEQYYREEAEAEARAFADEDDPGEEDLGGHVPGQFGKEEDPLAFDAHRERQRFGHKPSRD
jgi:hypothetical protein